ncbi:TPA: hypothetical protein ACTW9A_002452 [Raoultella planticola]
MIEYRGVLIPAPPPMVQLRCEPGFTGRVVIELEDGEFVKQYPLRKEETFCSLEAFSRTGSGSWISGNSTRDGGSLWH